MTENTEHTFKELHAFDFDGTLTRRDTLLELMRFVLGDKAFCLCMLRHLHLLVLMKLGLYPNWKAKQTIFSYCFKGMTVEKFNSNCAHFASQKRHFLRPKGTELVRKMASFGNKVVIVSASINNWVEPFFADVPGVEVIGTMVEERDGVLTGRFLTKNCYGEEKVRRLLQLYPERASYRLVAYGDSKGDFALLDFADEAHYKPF